jgi:hypothetical protein
MVATADRLQLPDREAIVDRLDRLAQEQALLRKLLRVVVQLEDQRQPDTPNEREVARAG